MKKNYIIITIIFLSLMLAFVFQDYFLVQIKGMKYISNSNKYSLSNSIISDTYSIDLDLNDLNSNINKIIYEDTSCKVYIKQIEKSHEQNNYRVFFESEGIYSMKEATLVSGITYSHEGYTTEMNSKIDVLYNNVKYKPSLSGISPLNNKNGDSFEIYLFPTNMKTEIFNNSATLIVRDLVKNTWVR